MFYFVSHYWLQHRVGSIIDVSEESKVYTIEGSMPDEEGDLYEGEVRPLIYGYLHKLGRNGKWQRRYFETDGESLTYYKSDKRIKVLASLDLCKVRNKMGIVNPSCVVFLQTCCSSLGCCSLTGGHHCHESRRPAFLHLSYSSC